MQLVGPFEPGEGLAEADEVLVALQDHHEGQFVGHQVLGNDLVAVPALPALGVALQLLLLCVLLRHVVVHCDQLHVYLDVLQDYEGPRVQVPPIPTLILHEVADQLGEGDLQVGLDELADPLDRLQCFPEVLLAGALDCVEGLDHLGVYDELADFVDLGSGGVLVVGAEHPALVVAVLAPAGAEDGGLHALALDEALDDADLCPVAEHRRQDCFHLCRADYFGVIAADPAISILRLHNISLTFFKTATSSFSSAPSVSLLVMV